MSSREIGTSPHQRRDTFLPTILAMLKHLRQLEWALSSEREQLAEERRKMAEYELTLQEIRRECRQPFVVPMLLDAFVDVTRFTNMALGKKT